MIRGRNTWNTVKFLGVHLVMAESHRTTAPPIDVPSIGTVAVDAVAVDRVLAQVDAKVRQQQRVWLAPGEVLAIHPGTATLVYVIKGGLCTASCTGTGASSPSELTAGDARLYTGEEPHSIISGGAFVLLATFDFLESETPILDLLPEAVTVSGLRTIAPAIAALAAELGQERGIGEEATATSRDEAPGSALICAMMAKTVLVSVIQNWVAAGCAPRGWPSPSGDPHLDRVIEAIHAHPGREWTVENLARTGAMSRSIFAARFRAATGTSPADYLADVRIRSAQSMLARGAAVSEVSRAIGYGSDDGFSRAFRKRVGTSPSTWRAENLSETAA